MQLNGKTGNFMYMHLSIYLLYILSFKEVYIHIKNSGRICMELYMVDISGGSNWSSYRKSFTFYFKYFKRRKISGEMKSNFSFLSVFFFAFYNC